MKSDRWPKSLIDSISVGICILNRDYEVVCWNEYMQSYTGIEGDVILGKSIGNFYPAFQQQKYKERIDLIFDGWPPLFFSSRLNALFGSEAEQDKEVKLYQDVTIIGIPDKDEECFYALISVNDVTDLNIKLEERNHLYNLAKLEIEIREKAEAKLLVSESDLRDLNATKDKLLSIIAHDLRGPISANLSGLDLLHTSFDDFTDEVRKDFLQEMLQGTKNTYNLLEDLLTWARLQVSDGGMSRSPFMMKDMIGDEIQRVKHLAEKKNIALVGEDIHKAIVEADRNMIQTVFRNLVSNAIKFTETGGSIRIDSTIEDKWIHVSISDTGVGMESEVVEHLFILESQHSTLGTNNEKGTGFGLVLCKEFMDKNQGTLRVESTPGVGSTFIFSLPVYEDG